MQNRDEKETVQEDVLRSADEIIGQHVTFGMIAGAIPVPIVDIASVTAIQLDMIHQLSKLYDIDYDDERGKSLVGALIASGIGVSIGRAGASMVKALPGVGTILGIGSQVIFSGASTYAIGNVFKQHFESGGNLFDLDTVKSADAFKSFFDLGKEYAKKKEKIQSKEEIFETLETMKDLHEKGVITQEEFEKTKAELLKKIVE